MSTYQDKELQKEFDKKLKGGAYVHVDETLYEPSDIQFAILHDLVKKYPPQMFQQQAISLMVKNTRDVICKNCGSDNVYVEHKQLRSADEATTKIYTCIDCGTKWRVG